MDHIPDITGFFINKKSLLDAKGKPLAPPSEEPTLEAALTKTKLCIFKSTQVNIIEKMQARLVQMVDKENDPEDLLTLSEAMRSSMRVLEDAEDIYPEAD
jgi:hypothetical protein